MTTTRPTTGIKSDPLPPPPLALTLMTDNASIKAKIAKLLRMQQSD
jgi:hypothetical protein